MTAALITNVVLAVVVLVAVLATTLWPIRRAHHEGRPLSMADGRQWMRPTIALRPTSARRAVRRPFALDLD